jgi:hypothetical protein
VFKNEVMRNCIEFPLGNHYIQLTNTLQFDASSGAGYVDNILAMVVPSHPEN